MYSWGEEASLLELPLNAGTSGHPGEGAVFRTRPLNTGSQLSRPIYSWGEEASLLELPLNAGTSRLLF